MKASPSVRNSGWVKRKRDVLMRTAPCWSRMSCHCRPSSSLISASLSNWGTVLHRATGRRARPGLNKLARERSFAWLRSWCRPLPCAGFPFMCSTCCETSIFTSSTSATSYSSNCCATCVPWAHLVVTPSSTRGCTIASAPSYGRCSSAIIALECLQITVLPVWSCNYPVKRILCRYFSVSCWFILSTSGNVGVSSTEFVLWSPVKSTETFMAIQPLLMLCTKITYWAEVALLGSMKVSVNLMVISPSPVWDIQLKSRNW